jgi:hypothetical protein
MDCSLKRLPLFSKEVILIIDFRHGCISCQVEVNRNQNLYFNWLAIFCSWVKLPGFRSLQSGTIHNRVFATAMNLNQFALFTTFVVPELKKVKIF